MRERPRREVGKERQACLQTAALVLDHVHDAKATAARARLAVSDTEGDLAIVSTGAGDPHDRNRRTSTAGCRRFGRCLRELPIPSQYRLALGIELAVDGQRRLDVCRLAADIGTDAPGSGALLCQCR
ncbi:hypothetical protein GCM10009576_085890 [Streptomyces rhizosphaericus]|uniref:Uncharacterized protein n=2 Tax=Streptomyces rhizosphaericus TaxID=114699 RepID=A0ABN1SNJ5_9ACTN